MYDSPCPTISGFLRDGTYLIIHIGNILNRFTPNISGFVLVSSKEMASVKNSLSWLGSSLICLWFWTSSHDGVRYSAISISGINSASLALLTRICDVPVMFLNEPRGQDVTVSIKDSNLVKLHFSGTEDLSFEFPQHTQALPHTQFLVLRRKSISKTKSICNSYFSLIIVYQEVKAKTPN